MGGYSEMTARLQLAQGSGSFRNGLLPLFGI